MPKHVNSHGSKLNLLVPFKHESGRSDMNKGSNKTGRSGNPANMDRTKPNTFLATNRVPVPKEMASKVKNKFQLKK